MDIEFGRKSECDEFARRHAIFFQRFPDLRRLIDATVAITHTLSNPADRVIFFLGRLAVEDFHEVVLMAANGYGVAALKLLRPMFERVVTMKHFISHPADVKDFLDFYWVSMQKAVRHIESAGGDPLNHMSPEMLAEIQANYAAKAERFKGMQSWTKMDLATMAREVGMGARYLADFYLPTLEIHTTVNALMTRMEGDSGPVSFKSGAQRAEADEALLGAHLCLSAVLEAHIPHFKLPLEAGEVLAIFRACWPPGWHSTLSAPPLAT